jgi:ferrous iron transport protein B
MNRADLKTKSGEGIFTAGGKPVFALVGNPNVGKSVIFSILTGKYVTVSNYPGTTIEINRAEGKIEKQQVVFIDTPGINNFIPSSAEERVTRDILLQEPIAAVLQIGDIKNLKRALFLSLQLAELDLPFVLNLNMLDELPDTGLKIDLHKLSALLGVGVNGTTAVRKIGTDKISRLLDHPRRSVLRPVYPALIEQAIGQIVPLLPELPIAKRALAIMLLLQDESLTDWVRKNLGQQQIDSLREIIIEVGKKISTPINFIITQSRYQLVDTIFTEVTQVSRKQDYSMMNRLDHYLIHPWWGLPSLLLALYLAYQFVGVLGAGILVDFMQNTVFGKYINPLAGSLLAQLTSQPLITDFLVGDYGLITMALTYGFAIVLPIVSTFFILFGIMEDSGYLPRLAMLVNNVFKIFGLNGKAVLPMVLGLGCDTMATMSARMLETRRERIIVTLLLALGVPCSAQLGIVLGMTVLLPWYATLIWITVIIMSMVLVGYLSSKIIPGKNSDFIIELPPLRVPQFSNILIKTIARLEWYCKEVIPLFILGTLILFIFSKINLLVYFERVTAPLVQQFLGLPAKATEAFIIGFLRRDYGAAGLYALATTGGLNPQQILVSMITITLFMPCLANFLMIIKELGLKIAIGMAVFIIPFAFFVGGCVNYLITISGMPL